MIKMACRALKMITRVNRSSFMLLHRMKRMPLWLLAVCALVAPGYVVAAVALADNTCTPWNGQGNINLALPPSVSFPPGITPDLSKPLYTSPAPYVIEYKCNTTRKDARAGITRLGNYKPLADALKDAGMQLKLRIQDSSDGQSVTWDPSSPPDENISFGEIYTGNTEKRTVYITVELYLTKSPSAGFYVVPPLTSFKMVPYYGNLNGFFLTTSATRIQYVPTCFVRTSLGTNNVNFGPVLTTDVDGTLSRHIPFNITADVNENCGKGNLQGTYNGYYLELPLKVSFMLNNGGEVTTDRKSILLYTDKDDKQLKNGLQLKINAPDGEPVTFNEASLPVNQFGNFQGSEGGGTWRVSKTYNAVLSSTGDPVITGKYSAQVTVKVEYY